MLTPCGAQAAATPFLTAFKPKFPKVAINITAELSKYADSKIDRSYIEGEPFVDYAMLQTVHDFPRWKAEGKLLEYKPPNFADVNDAIKDEDGTYVPVGLSTFGSHPHCKNPLADAIQINSVHSTMIQREREISPNKVPTSYADILNPFWKNKIALTYPNDDDGALYQFEPIIEQHGFRCLDGLLLQSVRWVRGATAASYQSHHRRPRVANGTVVLSFSGLGGFTPATSFLKVQKPQLLDRFMTWAQQGAIFASTKMPESAKLLWAFLLSDEWQEPIAARGAPAVRTSLSAGNDISKAENTEPLGYIEFMSNRAEVEWWRMQMETYIGLAVGPDPVLV